MRVSVLFLLTLFAGITPAPAQQDDEQAMLAILSEGPLNIGRDTRAWADNFHPDWNLWFVGNEQPRQRAPHMQAVFDYVERGAVVEAYQLNLVSLEIFGDQALARYHAREQVRDPQNGLRLIDYAAVTFLVREDGRWLIRASSLTFPAGFEPTATE